MKRLGFSTVLLMVLVVTLPLGAMSWGKKYVKFTDFVPKGPEQRAVLSVINDFRQTANDKDKDAHFSLFADDAILVVDAGNGNYHNEMEGKQQIIKGTPWTGTKIKYTKIWFGKIENGRAEVNTKTALSDGGYGTYEWIIVQVEDGSWKIQSLSMNL